MKKRMLAVALTAIMTLSSSFMSMADESTEQFPLKGYLTDYHTETTYEYITMKPITTEVLDKDGDKWMLNHVDAQGAILELAGAPSWQPKEGETHPITEEVRRFLNSFDWKNASEYDKAYQAAKFMVDSGIQYDGDFTSVNNDTYSCLVLKKSRCAGLSDTYHLLAKAVGLNCVNLGTSAHEWNNVQIDGIWRQIDMTDVVQGGSSIDRYLGQESPDEWTFDSMQPTKIGAIK